jgi:hypothetical protein
MLRSNPWSKSLRDTFGLEAKRNQCRSDGTISLEEVCYEILSRYRHFREVVVRYMRWNLGRVDLVDERSGVILAPIYSLDKTTNAEDRHSAVKPNSRAAPAADWLRDRGELPPLLKKILEEYSATGMPPAYLPKRPLPRTEDHHEQQENALALGPEVEPVFASGPRRWTSGNPQGREFRLASRAVGSGGGICIDHE